MSHFRLRVPGEIISALRVFTVNAFAASSEQMKNMLHCMHVEIGSKSTILTASNGEVTLIYTMPVGIPEVTETISANIQITDINREDAEGFVLITDAMCECSSAYLDYKKDIPAEISGETAHLNPRYVGKIALIAEWVMHRFDAYRFVTFGQNGKGNTIFKIDGIDNLMGIIKPMPMLTNAVVCAPSWIMTPLELAEDFSDLL